ncbi:glutamine--tRNA ligase/YqeY domain fusion protein [Anaerotignum propionicum]|uniref:Glutamine--tRNA ligase n=1 Tax=Anaerotignum propionicum DSM 1682 TaxID=991789 RepID=A0A0X8VAM9_ANAPI|nr:glutamine--tRNA ligase/YqeY domain fusion protein [Anaerotignum propionicum]AMJ42106.1 glutamine--tRNA ligase [Anaerotignum propionicum DSM 1682]SHE51542.1 glutaminyl-tRNA synthetase [[Clostridium] propionicum DSM 1682] [Anaerotignum propionicum DSM 1682]
MAEEKIMENGGLGATGNFIHSYIQEDLKGELNKIHTRFPPEPNGYLHIGHAKSICLNFGLANLYGGKCNLRFDDTNPAKEDVEYVDSIREDVKWLGFDWEDRLYYASSYFEQYYQVALKLIRDGKAFVCDLPAEEMRQYRGTLSTPGKESPYRNRSVEENLDLFERMKNGEFPDGSRTLRAKIDMASPNINMRDPVIYRIAHATHHTTGDAWCIYPMYDFAHPLEDAIEGITHSICTMEFEDHRPLYDWVVREAGYLVNPPRQIEFARLGMTNTVMSKRKLRALVEDGLVDGWDDPRMPTISGLRRRGYTPESIRDFCERIGVSKANSMVDSGLLDYCIRDDLKAKAKVVMAVLDPLKLVITNYPEGQVEMMELENNPETPELGTRRVPFTRELYIEREDFMEEPVKKFFRLAPGKEVRLKGAYFVTCTDFVKDENGHVVEVHCTYDPETRSGSGFEGRKVKGTLHWVSATENVQATARLYDYMMLDNPEDSNGEMIMNPNSLEVKECFIEPAVKEAAKGDRFQFMRNGYYIVDTKDTTEEKLVFNRIVSLKSSFKLS